ncbi:MAG: GAF domain-containing protein [Candidatus Cryptobacteroides sp.]|nr:GAF domain-containing protein [Candidatus Cryptobacteroides sp.]
MSIFRYAALARDLKNLLGDETDEVARMANAAALVKERMGFFWVGFYVVKDGELVLGPFQGPVACTRIGFGKGVCGTAWKEAKTIVVPDVEEFPGHIACSSMSKSEIVVPVFKDGSVIGVLDIDSDSLATFDKVDAHWLGRIAALV